MWSQTSCIYVFKRVITAHKKDNDVTDPNPPAYTPLSIAQAHDLTGYAVVGASGDAADMILFLILESH